MSLPRGWPFFDYKWKANKKWAPPQPHEHGKRTINGSAMWFNKQNKRWVPHKDANTAANLANAGAPQQWLKRPCQPLQWQPMMLTWQTS